HLSITTQQSEDRGQQLETTEEIDETSIVGRPSRVKRKTTENSTPSNSAEHGIESNDPQVNPAKKKRVGQSKTRPENEEKPNQYKCYKLRSLYCWVDGCSRSFPDVPKL